MTKINDDGLRALFRRYGGAWGQWVTIETGLVEQGVPDSNVMLRGLNGQSSEDVWIEMKATRAWAVSFKPAQVGWIHTRWRYGGNVWIAVRRRDKKSDRYDELHLVRGEHVRELQRDGLRWHSWKSWEGGPGRWDWDAVRAALASSDTA